MVYEGSQVVRFLLLELAAGIPPNETAAVPMMVLVHMSLKFEDLRS